MADLNDIIPIGMESDKDNVPKKKRVLRPTVFSTDKNLTVKKQVEIYATRHINRYY